MATKKEFLFELMHGQTARSWQLMYLLNELAYVRLGEPDQVDQYGRRYTKKSLKHPIDADLTLSRQIKKYFCTVKWYWLIGALKRHFNLRVKLLKPLPEVSIFEPILSWHNFLAVVQQVAVDRDLA